MWYQEPPGLEATGRAAPKPPPEFSARRRGVLHRAKEGRWQTKLLQTYSWSASSNGESTPSSDFPGTVSTASWKPCANPTTGFAISTSSREGLRGIAGLPQDSVRHWSAGPGQRRHWSRDAGRRAKETFLGIRPAPRPIAGRCPGLAGV